jgi:hypothetical protein
MKDAQRMYNYNSSASVEYGALQTKTPILAPNEAIEGFETYWNRANTENLPYLPFNHKDENGEQIPMPQRMNPPAASQLFLQGMQVASNEMNMSSGQYEAQFGNNPSAQSGKALNALQRKGDTATFHFIDNVARAIKYTGKILVDLIPKIYDTARVVRILGEDGSEKMIKIDPEMPQSYAKRETLEGIEEIYNPTVGRYDVTVAVGPSYTTRRQEAFDALIQLSQGNPRIMEVAGDLVMKAADFPMAEELAERLAKTLPPELQDKEGGESPEVQQIKMQADQMLKALQQQLQAAEQALLDANEEAKEMQAQSQDKDGELALKARELEIKQYDAETKRLQVELSAMQSQETIDQNEIALMQEAVAKLIDLVAPDEPPIIEETPEPPQGGFLLPDESVSQ